LLAAKKKQMENFIVSARKYRPVTFDTVVGQPNITVTLKNAIKSNHLAQAFLFTGPRGVGKTTTARILAKTINCENITEQVEACNKCDSCIAFNNNHSLNIYELDAASNNSVEDIRALVEQVRYAPQGGKYKVYIIDEVHMLSASAFNAFLKTLEEPPSYAVFILATTEKHKIIPTILSRCQIFDFSRITVEDITRHLMNIAVQENVKAEEDALHVIAQKSDGALRDALSMFDQMVSFAGNELTYKAVIQNLNILDYDYYFKITGELLEGNMSSCFLTFNEILANGFDGHIFINGLANHFRDLLVCKDEVTHSLLQVSPKIREKYKQQSSSSPVGWLLQALDATSRCDIQYRAAKNQRLHVELCLLQMCGLNPNAGLAQNASEAKKKIEPVKAIDQTPNQTPVAAVAFPSATPVSSSLSPSPVATPAYKTPSASSGKTKEPTVSKSISINQKLNKTVEEKKPEVIETVREEKPFTAADLQAVWTEMAANMQAQGKMAVSAAMNIRPPEIRDNELYFTIDHAGLEREMADVRFDILAFLRKRLSNTSLQLTVAIVKPTGEERKAYTPQEKFRRMAEKNPAINDLKEQLGLDIEY
jgi:DNA polymerase-3 subunit gamma/tau